MTEIKRGLNKKLGGTLAGIERESDRNQTKIERKTALTLLMQLGRDLFQGRKEQSFGFEKNLLFGNKRFRFNRGLNQVIGRGKTKGEKVLRMKKIEKKGVFSGKRDKCWSERDSCD